MHPKILRALLPLAVWPLAGSSVGVGGIAITGTSVQAVTGPAVELFPASRSFGTIAVGQASGTQTFSASNIGQFNL